MTRPIENALRVPYIQGMSWFRKRVESLLAKADIRLYESVDSHAGGLRPWDVQVNDPRFYRRAALQGSLGLGEAYMAGWWDCEKLDEFFRRLLLAGIEEDIHDWGAAVLGLRTRLFNLQSRTGAYVIGKRHYDLGDDLFERMLDPLMIYSCGYWRQAETLDEAQEAKLDLVARKLGLEKGMRVLDVGCGWGGAAKFMAERYGVEMVGVTVSTHQADRAQRECAGLPVRILLEDYRDLPRDYAGYFDRVFSIGMFEHVGYRNYDRYLDVISRCMKPDGLFLLHTIGGNRSQTHTDPWIARYIFPRSNLPSISQIGHACEGKFVMEDWHNFGPDYDCTLLAWLANFDTAWDDLKDSYDDRFRRMWRYFLCMSAGGFRARYLQLWQIVLSPGGVKGGYTAPR